MSFDGASYQARFDALAAAGDDVHGEARLVRSYDPQMVLDAGCGTGRVAIELASHGIEAIGVDADPSMLAAARQRGPTVTWIEADVCGLALPQRFDIVVMAGNVPLFSPPGTQAALVAAAGRHLRPGGLFIAGFSTDWADRPYTAEEHFGHCATAGLEIVDRFSTWSREPWKAQSPYLVCVARRPASALSPGGPVS